MSSAAAGIERSTIARGVVVCKLREGDHPGGKIKMSWAGEGSHTCAKWIINVNRHYSKNYKLTSPVYPPSSSWIFTHFIDQLMRTHVNRDIEPHTNLDAIVA